MGYEPADYTALEVITHNSANVAFPGDAVTRNQVETLGLRVGVQVRPERSGLVPQPAKTDVREVWVDYALNQGGQPDDLQDLSRADLIAEYGDPQTTPAVGAAPAVSAKKPDWVAYARSREPHLSEDDANVLTRDELVARYSDGGAFDREQAGGLSRTPMVPDPDAPDQPRQK
jgi:hypothetical protein